MQLMKIMRFINDDSIKETKRYNDSLLDKVIQIWNCFKITGNETSEE
jgi:hypothetical protein